MKNNNGRQEFGIYLNNSQLKAEVAESRRLIKSVGDSTVAESARIDNGYKKIAGAAAAFFSVAAIKQFGVELINIRGQFQTFEAVLTNTLQSPIKAKQSMMMLQEFAATTPFQVDALTGSFVKLANQGFIPTYAQMTKLGDLASSTGKGFDQLAEAIIDAQTGEFERLKEFGIRASKEGDKVTFTFKEQATQVDFTASSIQDYILSLGDLKGVTGANAEIAKTLTGQVSNLQDGITQMMNEIGQSSEGVLSGSVSSVAFLIENYKIIGETLVELIGTYGVYKAALITVNALQTLNNKILRRAVVEKKLAAMAGMRLSSSQAVAAASTKMLSIAQQGLAKSIKAVGAAMTANPYALIAIAIAALTYGIYKLCTAQTAAERAQEAFNEKIEEGKKRQDEFVSRTNELIDVIRTETNTRYIQTKAFKELNDKYPDLLENMSMEKLLLMDNLELQRLSARYIENKDKKDLFFELDNAEKKVATAKKALNDYLTTKLPNGNFPKETGLMGKYYKREVEEAEGYLKQWQNKLEKHRQIIADARSVDLKIADLSQNIILLEKQLSDIEKLKENAKKINPFILGFYEPQITSVNAQISARRKELKILKDGEAAEKEQPKNKAYWEKQKKLAQDALEAMSETEKGLENWNASIAEINLANSKLKQWDDLNKTGTASAKDYSSEVIDIMLETERSKIEILEDGRVKEIAQLNLTRKEKLAALAKEQKDIEGKLKSQGKKLSPEQKTALDEQRSNTDITADKNIAAVNKKYDDEIADDWRALTTVFLTEEQKRTGAISERYNALRKKYEDMNKASGISDYAFDEISLQINFSESKEQYDALVADYQTYADKREKIENKFNADIAALNKIGSKAQIDEAVKQKEKAIKSLNFEEASEGVDLTKLFGNLDNLTLPSMKTLRDKIKAWIDVAGKSLNPEDLKAVSDAFSNLEIKIADKDPFAVLKSSISDWKEANEKLKDAQGELNEINDRGIASVEELAAAEKKLKDAQGERATAVAKANEAIHSAANYGKQAVGTAKDVTNMLSDLGVAIPEEVGKAIEGVSQIMDGLASVDLTRPFSIVTSGVKIIGGFVKTIGAFFNGDGEREKSIQRLQERIDALSKSYDVLQKAINKAYSTDASKLLEQSNEMLENQAQLIDQQIAVEESKKNPDDGRIDEWIKQRDELSQKIEDNNEQKINVTLGSDWKSDVDSFVSYFLDSIGTVDNGAKDFAKQMKKNIITELLKKDIGKAVEQMRQQVDVFMDDGALSDSELSKIDRMSEDIGRVMEQRGAAYEKILKNEEDATSREASARGITTASQESVDENNARLTTMQGHTHAISENIKLLIANSSMILQVLMGIESNTRHLSRLERVESDISSTRTILENISIHGIKIK